MMKRLALYTAAFNLSVSIDEATVDGITENLTNGETIVIRSTSYGEPVTYWVNPDNVSAIVISPESDE
jgi:hypothetical protein